MSFEDINTRTRPFGGAKGLIFLGQNTLLAMVRDEHAEADRYPGYLDLVGGGRELSPKGKPETPFETFRRETREEIGLHVRRRHIVYTRWYPRPDPRYTGVMFVARLPESAEAQIQLGDEGKSIERFESLAELLRRDDHIPVLRARIEDYAVSTTTVIPFAVPTLPLDAQVA